MSNSSKPAEPLTEQKMREIWSSLAYSFSNLFPGNPKGFYQRGDAGSYIAVHREATVLDYLAHLSGYPDRGLLCVPLLPSGNCHWAAIDVDRHAEDDAPIDWTALARRVTELQIPLVVCCSKGGKGAWLFCFFKDDDGLPASDARRLLEHYVNRLDLGTVEIFPKQKDLDTNKGLGSGINIPYRLIPETFTSTTVAFGKNGEPLDIINDFIALSDERKVYGCLLVARLNESGVSNSQSRTEEPNETTVENAVAYLDRACAELETLADGRQQRATQVCFWLGRVIGGKPNDARLEFQTIKTRITEALDKTHWSQDKFEVIERQLREGMTRPIKIVEDDEIELRAWPDPPSNEAFSGLVGEFVDLWAAHTEASPVALAAQFVTFFGHAVGRKAFFAVGGDDHHTNLEVALVGPTSFARKGQSYGCVIHVFNKVSLALGVPIIEARGLSSGEGLIAAVRNERTEKNKKGVSTMVDEGVFDKRLLVFESEFASVLRRMVREGNTLSEVLRQAWDSGDLATMTRNAPLRASGAHISVITHVTPNDLQLYLSDVSTTNGFANRFIFIATRRVRSLPDPGRPPESALREFAARLAHAIEFGQTVAEMKRSPEATAAWSDLYETLSAPRTGRQHNSVCARAPAHVLRLSMIYALADGSSIIEVRHLTAAAALWDYAERTSRFVFGDSLGDRMAEKILALLNSEQKGFSTRELIGKVGKKKDVPGALRLLFENGQIRVEKTAKGGGQRWSIP